MSNSSIATITRDELGRDLALPLLVWSEKVEHACGLIAHGASPAHAALECDASVGTIRAWLKYPEFQNRVLELRDHFVRETMAYSVASVACRTAAYQQQFEDIQEIRKERAADPQMQDVPGGKTGRMVLQKRQLGKGEKAEIIEEYKADGYLMTQELAVLKQAAQDLGQWSEKRVITGDGGGPIQFQTEVLEDAFSEEELKHILERIDKAAEAKKQRVVVNVSSESMPATKETLPE